MTAATLSKSYTKLTPAERFSALVSASVRGDDAEHRRLLSAAPQVEHVLSHHYGLADRWVHMALLQRVEALDLAGRMLSVVGHMLAAQPDGSREAESETHLQGVKALGGVLLASLEGWKRFGVENGVDARALWRGLPGDVVLGGAVEFATLLGVVVNEAEVEAELVVLRKALAGGIWGLPTT